MLIHQKNQSLFVFVLFAVVFSTKVQILLPLLLLIIILIIMIITILNSNYGMLISLQLHYELAKSKCTYSRAVKFAWKPSRQAARQFSVTTAKVSLNPFCISAKITAGCQQSQP